MAQQDVLDYIRKTPHNSNVNVVKGMLGSSESSSLPDVTTEDNGDVLTVVNGEWDKAELNLGYECINTETTVFNGSITTQDAGAGFAFGEFTPMQAISGDILTVTMNDTEYELPKIDLAGQEAYGEFDNAPIFTTYPCVIVPAGQFVTQNPGTYTVKLEIMSESITTTECFDKAVKNVVNTSEHILDGKADGSLRSNTSTLEGNGYTLGQSAVAVGANTQASGGKSHAEGMDTTASGIASHAEGNTTAASGNYSHSEGFSANAEGDSSHAEGESTTASGVCSHAEGELTTANEPGSHAEGYKTTASGFYSHAEGSETIASKYASHAEGTITTASGNNSHAQNLQTIAQGYAQTAIGKYNVAQGIDSRANSTDYAFIIGNGTDENNRSNAFAIKWDGTFVFANGTEITPAQFTQILALLS